MLIFYTTFYTISHNHFLILVVLPDETIRDQVPALFQETIVTVRVHLLQPLSLPQLGHLLLRKVYAAMRALGRLLRADYHVQISAGEPAL